MLPTTWAALEPHATRQGLFLVAEAVELAEVAFALATDDQESVKRWIDDGTIRRPTADETSGWGESPVAFYAVIVQPFVLCRPIVEPG